MSNGAFKGRAVELAGLIGVIASLAFVGLEIRQNTRAVRAATIQAVSDQAMDLTLSLANDEHFPRLVTLMVEDGVVRADLSREDARRLIFVVVAGMRRMENVYLQVEAGILDEGALGRTTVGFYRNPFVRELWAATREDYDPGFAVYWEGMITDP